MKRRCTTIDDPLLLSELLFGDASGVSPRVELMSRVTSTPEQAAFSVLFATLSAPPPSLSS